VPAYFFSTFAFGDFDVARWCGLLNGGRNIGDTGQFAFQERTCTAISCDAITVIVDRFRCADRRETAASTKLLGHIVPFFTLHPFSLT
jgi:hypothetical protein